MDVDRILAGTPEPATSMRLQAWIRGVRTRLSPDQQLAMERWFNNAPFEAGAQQAFRDDQLGTALLAALAERLERRRLRAADRFAERAAPIPRLLQVGRERPALASTLVWMCVGATEPILASSLIHAIRERSGLPGLRRSIGTKELPAVPEMTWFDDRQVEDAGRWAEHLPAPHAVTLADAVSHAEAQRAAAGATIATLVPFIQRTASYLLTLSTRSLDPLGFILEREAQLVGDPPFAKRLEVASWARTVGRTLCLRGQMVIMTLPVKAPWPLTVEIIASELGVGISGAFGIVMRLAGELSLPSAVPAPLLLCLPEEPIESLGARFERWSQRAYPLAVAPWRALA